MVIVSNKFPSTIVVACRSSQSGLYIPAIASPPNCPLYRIDSGQLDFPSITSPPISALPHDGRLGILTLRNNSAPALISREAVGVLGTPGLIHPSSVAPTYPLISESACADSFETPIMEDFNSETDSDYTSYWRDWVSCFAGWLGICCLLPCHLRAVCTSVLC